jgi:hypothetical protein
MLQVQQHHEKLQQERENAGIQKLQASLPKLCHPVLALALQDCGFDADRALLMLRQFQSDKFDNLALINRKRKRLQSLARGFSPDSSEGTASEGPGNTPRKHLHKHRKASKQSSKKDKKASKHKSKHKHKGKHRSREKHKRRRRYSTSDSEGEGPLEFGAFGIIRESDYALKKPEFSAWASEVKHIDIESLPRCESGHQFMTSCH